MMMMTTATTMMMMMMVTESPIFLEGMSNLPDTKEKFCTVG